MGNGQLIILDAENHVILDSGESLQIGLPVSDDIIQEVSAIENDRFYKELNGQRYLFIINTSPYSGFKVIRKVL